MANVMQLSNNALRSVFVAPPGRKLVAADLSNIEGRILAWMAGEEWKLKAFAEFDAGVGSDLYKLAYARSFQVGPETVDKEQRQLGKVQELALGYEGGVGAFVSMIAAYGIDLDAMAAAVLPVTPRDVQAEARKAHGWASTRKKTFGLSEPVYVACDSVKRLWRRAHPATTQLWKDFAEAMRSAIANPKGVFGAGRCIMRMRGNWLTVRLPSGRCLCYPSPRLQGDDQKISYMGQNQYTRKWSRISTYGGKGVENGDQAIARDVLAHNMPIIEDAGYELVLTIHDEPITEAPDSPEFNAEHLSSLLAANPPWADGLPLAASGFEGYRYRKE